MKLTQEMIDKIQELMNHTKKDGTTNWLDGDDIKISLAGTFAADRFIVIGNESKGVSDDIKKQSETKIKIPGYGFAESLNASVATGIILYELSKINLQK